MQASNPHYSGLTIARFIVILPGVFFLTFVYMILANIFFGVLQALYFSVKSIEKQVPGIVRDCLRLIFPYRGMDMDFKLTNTLLLAGVMALVTLIFVVKIYGSSEGQHHVQESFRREERIVREKEAENVGTENVNKEENPEKKDQ